MKDEIIAKAGLEIFYGYLFLHDLSLTFCAAPGSGRCGNELLAPKN
jgi:hypothetical protein